MLEVGARVKEVAEVISRSKRAVRDLRTKHRQSGSVVDKPRSGRSPILSLKQKNNIYRAARAAPKIEYSKLAQAAIFVNAECEYIWTRKAEIGVFILRMYISTALSNLNETRRNN